MESSTIAEQMVTVSASVTTMQKNEDMNGGDLTGDWDIIDNNGTNEIISDKTSDQLEEISDKNDNSQDEECTLCDRKLCSPRLLSCLHAFCESCLEKQLINDENVLRVDSEITCSICGQQTFVGPKGVASLHCDYVLTNILDMSAIENMTVLCTSCKTEESAIARCSDCANFLCPSCNTAHQYMRCFENHKVIAFEDLRKPNKAIPIHKPIFCELHTAENMKFYCYTCQKPICNECLLVDHKTPDHKYERLSDAKGPQIEELVNLISESKTKISECEKVSLQLENVLGELKSQHDETKDLILKTFESYTTILEKCRDNALNNLKQLHSEKELEIIDTFYNLDKIKKKIEDANRFTVRLLEHGDTIEILALKKIVSTQLMNLINNIPKLNVGLSIQFQTDYHDFISVMNECFGKLKIESTPNVEASSEAITTMAAVQNQQVVPISSPISSVFLSPSMKSSFEGPMYGFKSIGEYDMKQSANPSKKGDLNDPSVVVPITNLSPTPFYRLTNLFASKFPTVSTNHAISNFRTLAPEALRKNFSANEDLRNLSLNGDGDMVLGSNPSPVMNEPINVGSLNPDTPLDRSFRFLSNSTPPIFTQNRVLDDLKNESISNMEEAGTDSVVDLSNNEAGNYNYSRSADAKQTPMQIRSKFGQLGPGKGQFNSPHGFSLGVDDDIIVADTNNHRIQIFDKMGQFKSLFGVPGKDEGQLWYPRKVAVMRNCGKFVVCDRGNERSRMQIFMKNGHFIKKIAIRYIDIVAGLAVTNQGHIVAVDSVSPTVFIINDSGDLLSWFDCSDYMREPSDIAIHDKEFFVCDFKGHCVVVFNDEGKFLRRIGCENITKFPNGIDISNAGDVLIGDSHGNRFHVAVFSREGSLISEFECPHVKVSRCCGLKITSEGYIVTLAKNNHHVLVLNTLYIL